MKGILLTNEFDLVINTIRDADGLITSGIVLGNIDYQRCKLIMEVQKGEIKEYPTIGFGIDSYLKSGNAIKDKQKFIAELTKELKSDGIDARITINNDLSKFEIEIL